VPFNFRLNLQSVFRRLGIQSGARLPQLNDQVQMTMLVTDLSRLVPAPIEPRGFAGANNAVAGQFSQCQLRSLSPGGCFIEKIFLRGSVSANTMNYVLNVNTIDLGLAVQPNINVGGEQIFSIFTAGSTIAAPTGARLPAPDGFSAVALELGVFVPNQFFFTLAQSNVTQRLDVAIVYRELPSIEEVG